MNYLFLSKYTLQEWNESGRMEGGGGRCIDGGFISSSYDTEGAEEGVRSGVYSIELIIVSIRWMKVGSGLWCGGGGNIAGVKKIMIECLCKKTSRAQVLPKDNAWIVMNWNGRKYFTAEVYIIAARTLEWVAFHYFSLFTTFTATRTIIYRTQCNNFCINYSPSKYLV